MEHEREEANQVEGRMRRREASVLKGAQGGLQRKWPQCDPRGEPRPAADMSLKLLDEQSRGGGREEQLFMWRLINSNPDPFVCVSLCVKRRGM